VLSLINLFLVCFTAGIQLPWWTPSVNRKQKNDVRKIFRNAVDSSVADPKGIIIPVVKEEISYSHRFKSNEVSSHLKNNVYATFIGSTSYFPALEVFLYTLTETRPLYTLALCVAEIDGYQELIKGMERVLLKYDNKLNYEIFLWPVIPSPKDGNEHERREFNWMKLQLWTMLEYEKIFYVDLDVIFMKNIDDVFHSNFTQFLGTYDSGRRTHTGEKKLSGAVFMLKPSISTLMELLEKKQTYHASGSAQGLFNSLFLNENSCCLPEMYNIQKSVQSHLRGISNTNSSFIIHFTGEKPWTSWSSTHFRKTYVNEETRRLQSDMGQWDADTYPKVHNLWKEKYLMARKDEVKDRLAFYQGYHNEYCWDKLTKSHLFTYKYIKLNGPMRSVDDVNASAYYPLLEDNDYQEAIGEIGAMIALSRMEPESLPPFIGMSSWRAFIKEDWKEGASIDWTKVTFDQNSIYFWYSLYHPPNRNFYEIVDNHHHGMFKVMKEVIPYPLPDFPESMKRFIYSHYIILSKDLFKKYMESVEEIIPLFLQRYPIGSKCPYSLPPETRNAEKRCIGYLLERYVNIWAFQNNVTFVYAVDHPEWRNS
jgi:lipopolysaccharide biosynthesis glycosyltransferase